MHRIVEIIKQARLGEVHTASFLSYVECIFHSPTWTGPGSGGRTIWEEEEGKQQKRGTGKAVGGERAQRSDMLE